VAKGKAEAKGEGQNTQEGHETWACKKQQEEGEEIKRSYTTYFRVKMRKMGQIRMWTHGQSDCRTSQNVNGEQPLASLVSPSCSAKTCKVWSSNAHLGRASSLLSSSIPHLSLQTLWLHFLCTSRKIKSA